MGSVRFRVGLFAAVKHVMAVSIPYVRTNYRVNGIWVFPNYDNLFENDIAAFCLNGLEAFDKQIDRF